MYLAVNSSWHNHHQEKKTKIIVYMPIDSMENKRQAQKKCDNANQVVDDVNEIILFRYIRIYKKKCQFVSLFLVSDQQ